MRRPPLIRCVAGLVAMLATAAPATAAPVDSPVALANGCLAIGPAGGAATHPSTYLKPTGFGTYMLLDADGQLLGVRGGAVTRVGPPEAAGPAAEWRIARVGPRAFTVRSTATGRGLGATPAGRFAFVPARGCRPFPEAEVGATGTPAKGTTRGGAVRGFADTHVHITADMRAGGRLIHGEAFDRFGVPRALGDDATDHGADGGQDIVGNLLRSGAPFGTHATDGWPTFTGWPTNATFTHQQTYYVWLERAYAAGLRLVVAQTVEDDQLCRLVPRRAHSCSEPATVALEVRRLRALQGYVDAQAGGRGRGWFRLVFGPAQARRVAAGGKLAVVIGVESSNPFGCRLSETGRATCTKADVDRGVDAYRRLGVRSLFVAHWFDNSFAGAALEGGTKGKFINAMNRLETGHFFATGRCPAARQGEEVQALAPIELEVLGQFFPAAAKLQNVPEPRYPAGRQCNGRGLTPLGAHLVRRLMDRHMLVEVDHLSERARDAVLAIAKARRYPVVSSHNGTGGSWTPAELRTLARVGGVASATPGDAPAEVAKILRLARYGFAGVGLGTDTGGLSSLPAARKGAAPLRYPFKAYDARVTFTRQRTGTRTFDLNVDGVAHYGLVADLLADVRRQPRGAAAVRTLFGSAEGYLHMWRRADPGR